ncbi:hypothetical protein [Cellulophaga sp. Z1A5H]|uniref:hypothetical protein n=1 Tax=Cellulophaga sp. Z1A5H TaxID=2687291 RepID=UPI0013FE2BBD|nr:hypothetical protein [Cellulophaga sp. Z1A5H]
MKVSLIFYLFIAMLLASCGERSRNDSKKSDYYSTKIDTSYNVSSRTKIDNITRRIYDKTSNDAKNSLRLSTEIEGGNDFMKFSIMKIDASDLKNAKTSSLVFKNIEEVQEFFNKIDTLEIGKNLMERKKVKHYEINKGKSSIDITQFDGEINIPKKLKLSTSEYDGIKSAFKKYLLENQ